MSSPPPLPFNSFVSSFDLGRVIELLAYRDASQCQPVMSCLWEREFMLGPTFGNLVSWKLQIASSPKQCIASLKFVMAGPNALPK